AQSEHLPLPPAGNGEPIRGGAFRPVGCQELHTIQAAICADGRPPLPFHCAARRRKRAGLLFAPLARRAETFPEPPYVRRARRRRLPPVPAPPARARPGRLQALRRAAPAAGLGARGGAHPHAHRATPEGLLLLPSDLRLQAQPFHRSVPRLMPRCAVIFALRMLINLTQATTPELFQPNSPRRGARYSTPAASSGRCALWQVDSRRPWPRKC